jgi:ADP-heptose:LPS heptosyltransferase
MKPRLIRLIDFWLGVPLCIAATILRRVLDGLSRFRGKENPVRRPKSVVFVQVTEMGAKVLAYPAYRFAVDRVGSQNVYVLTFADSIELLKIMDMLPKENILGLRKANLVLFGLDLLKALWTLRRIRVEGVVNYEFFSRAGALISWATGGRFRAGLHRFTSELPYCGDLFTHRVNYNTRLHTAETFYVLVKSLFADRLEEPMLKARLTEKLEAPVFTPQPHDLESVDSLFEKLQRGRSFARRWILNPNAGDLLPLRKWPLDRWHQFIALALKSYPDLEFVITGTETERAAGEDFVKRWGSDKVLNLCGRTTLRQLLTLYSRCEVLITNDSGPGHFASMTGIATVVLFGPETPLLWAPLGNRVRALTLGLACSPCVNVFNHRFSPCRNNVCMQQISPEDVLICVEELLKRVNIESYAN